VAISGYLSPWRWRLDSPRVALIRQLFELLERDDLTRATDELLAHSADDVVFVPHASLGREIRGREELRKFWADYVKDGVQVRAGAYSIAEDGDSVVVTGWVRTIEEGRLADTQSRWVYRFNDRDQVVSARVERA
jgi:ketosteroid isomerase-like protein